MPGHARRACPKGTPEGRVPKGPRRGHCGRRPPGGAKGGGEGGVSPPLKKFNPKFFVSQKFPRRVTAAAGRQGVLEMERAGEGGGSFTPPKK